MDKLKISVVIPVYNSEKTIKETVEKTVVALDNYEIADIYRMKCANS